MLFNLGPIGGTNIEITVNGETYRFTGDEISNEYFKVSPYNTTGWKMWLYQSLTVKFNSVKPGIDVCVVGKGAGGGWYNFWPSDHSDHCGSGGSGGVVTTLTNQTLTAGADYSVVIDDSGTSFGSLITVGVGGGASGGRGGSYSPEGGYSYHHSGTEGPYAFNGDSTFDGIKYAGGGEGGLLNYEGSGTGSRYNSPGSGGGGGGQSGNSSTPPSDGRRGIVLLRSAT